MCVWFTQRKTLRKRKWTGSVAIILFLSRESATAGPLHRSCRQGVHWLPQSEWVTFPGSYIVGCNREIGDSLATFSDTTHHSNRGQYAELTVSRLDSWISANGHVSIQSARVVLGSVYTFDNAELTYFIVNWSVFKLSVSVKVLMTPQKVFVFRLIKCFWLIFFPASLNWACKLTSCDWHVSSVYWAKEIDLDWS